MKLTTTSQTGFRYPLRGSTQIAPRWLAIVLPAAAILICAAIWAAAIQIVHVQRDSLLTGAARENRNRVIAYDHFVAGILDRADSAATQLARQYRDALPGAGASPQLLTDSAAIDPLFARVEVLGPDGLVRWSSRPGGSDVTASAAAFRLLSVGGAREPLLTPSQQTRAGKPAILFARAIHRQDGGFGGIVALHIPIDRLTGFYEGADFRPHDLISVVRLDGLTLARREGPTVSFGQNLAGKLAMQHQNAEPWGTYIGPSSVDGVTRIFSQRRLPRYGVFVSVGLGLDDVLAPSYGRARIFYLTVAALTLALLGGTFAFWLGLRRREAIIRRLAATNKRLCEAQAIGKMGDWELDLQTRLLACSDEICRMHGRDPKDDIMTSDEALAFHGPEGRVEIEQTLRTAILSKQPAQCEVVSTMGDGRVAHLRIRMSPVVDSDGKVRTVLGTEQDITTERWHEQLRAEVAHITRVEAVNVMAATIAHELSQPLTAAGNYLGAATYLVERGNNSLVEQERLAVLLGQASRQISLSGKIIARARDMVADRRTGEVASLDDIVEEAIALSKIADPAVARATVTAQLEPDTGHVAADKVQIQQVLLNLIRNAAQAVAQVDKPQVLVTSHREEGGMVMVSVADNGKGLPDKVDIFAPFATVDRNGLGIGLSICRTIVDSYGGRIWSGTSPLGGAAICFTLPLDELALLYDVA
ncbi:ATP-binding protein [Sphingomonas psychrotolerans]|uniref:histidine kinase n=1 Tax=Sphingomonas psychrotolerans TaxID=1327635 RepID=A0ABU3N7X8_9SPHN|nr:ATP-binding protein [Sphingomonas psychrotolerans]MDT8759601.1 ATP-binding protein [Sphingomonas psychrotolerans]